MRKTIALTSVVLLLLLPACATLTAPEETKALQEATTSFAAALKGAEEAQEASREASIREEYRLSVSRGTSISVATSCYDTISARIDNFLAQEAGPAGSGDYNPSAADQAFAAVLAAPTCDVRGVEADRPQPAPIDPSTADPAIVASANAKSLSGAARNLNAYVKALADIATGESSGKLDAARAKAFEAGRGLVEALGGGPIGAAIGQVAERIVASSMAARRNAITREFLVEWDAIMPALMERLGRGARLATGQALRNRSAAAMNVARTMNETLNSAPMITTVDGARRGTPLRMTTYDELSERLHAHNAELIRLRSADPMASARNFAKAHRALKDVFLDPDLERAAIAQALADFTEAAQQLQAALAADE